MGNLSLFIILYENFVEDDRKRIALRSRERIYRRQGDYHRVEESNVLGKELLGSSSTEDGAHLVEHLLLGGYLSLFGQIPCRSESLSAWYDGYLDEGVGISQVP